MRGARQLHPESLPEICHQGQCLSAIYSLEIKRRFCLSIA